MFAIVPEDSKRRFVAKLGKYDVWYDPLQHRPYGLFRIYKGQRYIAAQISHPCESDCQWHDRERGVYATESFRDDRPYGYATLLRGIARRRGRPRKADSERELQEALAS